MKHYIITALLTLSSAVTFAQKTDKLIKEKDVRKTIATLTADDMEGRGNFKPGLEKAARFIEAAFKKAKLKPLPGNKDYRQTFYMTRRTLGSAQATINGAVIPAENVLVLADSSFSWTNVSDAEVAHITADQPFATEYRKYQNSSKNTVVLVDPKQEAAFKRTRERMVLGRGAVTLKSTATPHVVFVLESADNVQSIDINYTGKSENLPLSNITGMIPGKTKPDEYVVFGGHYDHLGIVKPMNGDSIANGADDDASGTTA
jgi:Zn-dependent M28 family amino/carboxypeptidase